MWDDKSISDEVLKTSRNFELTNNAIIYLKRLFNMFKVNNEIDAQGIEKVFAPCRPEDGLPFDAKIDTEYAKGISLPLWVGLWQKAFSENPPRAFRFLVYTGYIGTLSEIINPIKTKTKDMLGTGN